MDKFKEVVEDVSGGKIAVTVHKGTLGENENELIEKLEMGAASMVVASPGFMTAIGVPEVDIFSLEYLFDSFDHWEKCLDGEFGDKMKEVVKEKTGKQFGHYGLLELLCSVITTAKASYQARRFKGYDNPYSVFSGTAGLLESLRRYPNICSMGRVIPGITAGRC